jgi:hypothetical protein
MTKILMAVQSEEGGGSSVIEVSETFDEVMNKIQPLNQPSSSLEMRENLTFHKEDGNRIWLVPNHVVRVEES